MIHLFMPLLARQVLLELALGGVLWLVPGGRAILGLAPAIGMFAGAWLAGRAGVEPDRRLIRRLALGSGLAHATLGATAEGVAEAGWAVWGDPTYTLGAAAVTAIVLGAMAWVLTLAGLDLGAYTKRR